MRSFSVDVKYVRNTIIVFCILAAILLGLGFTLDTGLALRRRTSDITLEDFLILLGALCMLPVLFSLLRLSPERCALEVNGQNVAYRNIGFGWPLVKSYNFTLHQIESLNRDDGTVQLSFRRGSEYFDKDREENEADLEIDAPMFGLSGEELEKILVARG
mgnify:FL=1